MAEKVRGLLRRWLGVERIYSEQHKVRQELYECQKELGALRRDFVALSNNRTITPINQPDSVFDKPNDKIQPSGTTRYVPIARRRAAAEMASQGPQSHTEHVRANNQKALETT